MEPFASLAAMMLKVMSRQRHLLIVDEERESRTALVNALSAQGFRVSAAGSDAGMQRALERSGIDLVVLDVLRDDALKRCRALRASSDVPVIVLARRADEVDRIVALEMGADDYLAKPVNSRELLARIHNLLRRASAAGASAAPSRVRLYHFGGWRLDIVARELSDPQGSPTTLRSSEYRVLASLLAHGNRVVSREKLVELARGRDAAPFDRSIDVRISRLRQILGDDARLPRIIKTVHGEGYVIGVTVERS